MNQHRLRLALCGVALALCACDVADASPATPDGGTPAPKATRKRKAEKKEPDLAELLSGGDGAFADSYPQCMTPDEATRLAAAPAGTIGTIGLGSRLPPDKPAKRNLLPECPDHIWTYVGAARGGPPVGNVQAPLGTAATRKERKRTAKACCYLMPPSPGLPNG